MNAAMDIRYQLGKDSSINSLSFKSSGSFDIILKEQAKMENSTIKDLDHKFKGMKSWSKPGFVLKVSYDAKVKKDGLFSEHGRIEFSNCRLDVDVRYGDMAPAGIYTLENGLILRAGIRKVISLDFNWTNKVLNPRSKEFTDALYRLATKNGFGVIDEKIFLRVEPNTRAAKSY